MHFCCQVELPREWWSHGNRTLWLALLTAVIAKKFNSRPIRLFLLLCLSLSVIQIQQAWYFHIQINVLARALKTRIIFKSLYEVCKQTILTALQFVWRRHSTDKLHRCRRLPLEQAKLRQILVNKSESVSSRKWFERWCMAESLSDRLRCKVNHVFISQQHECRRGRPILSSRNATTSTITTWIDLSRFA